MHLFYNMYEIIYVEIMPMPGVKRRPILFEKSKEAEIIFEALPCGMPKLARGLESNICRYSKYSAQRELLKEFI